jgi:hypothetical protein
VGKRQIGRVPGLDRRLANLLQVQLYAGSETVGRADAVLELRGEFEEEEEEEEEFLGPSLQPVVARKPTVEGSYDCC